jgi:hypothetical protein
MAEKQRIKKIRAEIRHEKNKLRSGSNTGDDIWIANMIKLLREQKALQSDDAEKDPFSLSPLGYPAIMLLVAIWISMRIYNQ